MRLLNKKNVVGLLVSLVLLALVILSAKSQVRVKDWVIVEVEPGDTWYSLLVAYNPGFPITDEMVQYMPVINPHISRKAPLPGDFVLVPIFESY